jgi:hypothetical protein
MILLLHIVIALSSIALSGFAYARPTQGKLRGTYTLVVATLATGTYLVIAQPAHMASACVSGLTYLAVVGVAIGAAQRKLARETIQK